jgi:hypothetical protein
LHCWLYDDTKPQVIGNKIYEGTDCLKAALQSGMTSLQVIVGSVKSVGWGSNETLALLYLVPWLITLTYGVKTQDLKHFDSRHRPEHPLM